MEYTNEVFRNDYWEWRMRAGDYIYQIMGNMSRVNDGWTKSLVGYTGFCFMMLTHGPLFKLHFFVSALLTAARIRDKGAEPTMDEVWVLD